MPQRRSASKYRFRASRYQSQLSCTSTSGSETSTTSTGVQCDDLSARADGLSLTDLQLFHHFVTSTYCTVAEDSHGRELWQVHVPQWSVTFSSILHLLLAFSALHRSHQQPTSVPELRHRYIEQADQHFTFGVTTVTAILSQFDLTPENAQPIYIAAILICFVYFARGPPPGEFLVFSDSGQAEWLVLLRGVRLIVQTRHQHIFKEVMAPPDADKEIMSQRYISPEWHEVWSEDRRHLLEAQQMVRQRSADFVQGDMYVSLMDHLIQTFEEVYVKMSAHRERVGLMQIVVGWLYRLPETYISLLQEKEPAALVILAHWSILLRYMRPVWYMRGWDYHVIDGVQRSLPWDWKEWASWPLRRIHLEFPG